VEVKVPFSALGTASETPIRFCLAVANETVPPDGWFDIASPE